MSIDINIGDSFELLSKAEWDEYLSATIFDNMRIDINKFDEFSSNILMYPRLKEAIEGHNNKIGDLMISYALCKHYYDKGIPDDPWYISPGTEGQSVQYVPNFQQEHWMRRYWFNHFAENLYLKFFSVWDDVIEILNIFYGIDEKVQDYRFRSKVINKLKENYNDVALFLKDVLTDETYQKANGYRTNFVHGYAPSTITDGFLLEKDKTVQVPVNVNGKTEMVEMKSAVVLSCRVGNYTLVREVMENIEKFAEVSGEKILELISLITK